MLRGINRQEIFDDDADKLLKILKDMKMSATTVSRMPMRSASPRQEG